MTVNFEERISKWEVVALGELQQPGGVGATQEYNPVVDGPNPEGPSFGDNASNSPEQEVALETWVNMAVDMLNRGSQPEEILAKLAHDGCPEPEVVLERATAQPEQDPVSDEIGQDPFNAPPQQSPTGEMESVNQQPPVLGSTDEKDCFACGGPPGECDCAGEGEDDDPKPPKHWEAQDAKNEWAANNVRSNVKRVKIANSSLTGVEIERWEGQWGEGFVMVALDDGGTMKVSPDVVQEFEGEAPRDPVTDIQTFIDGLPEVEPTRPHIEARIKNLEVARRAVRSTISSVGLSDQVKLDTIDAHAKDEIMALRESLGAVINESDVAYLSGQQTYRPHGLNLPNVKRPVAYINEAFEDGVKAKIFAAELPNEMVNDVDAVAYAAARHAHLNNADLPKFVREVEAARQERVGMGLGMDNMDMGAGLGNPLFQQQPQVAQTDFTCPMCGSQSPAGGTDHCPNPECPTNGGSMMGPGAPGGAPQTTTGPAEGLYL